MRRMPICHIQRAWPEFDCKTALCGATPKICLWGGMLSSNCRNCLRMALYAGQHLTADPSVVRPIMRRLQILGILGTANAKSGAEPGAPEATKK